MNGIALDLVIERAASKYLRQRQYETFALIVDGDHSDENARTDLRNVVEHVSVGGLLVFDDIIHPSHPGLRGVWRETS